MEECCYLNDVAKHLASGQLSKTLWDMAVELWLLLYLASKGTFCSSEVDDSTFTVMLIFSPS